MKAARLARPSSILSQTLHRPATRITCPFTREINHGASVLRQSESTSAAFQSPRLINGLDPFYLRDSCSCSRCVDVSTRQKLFETSDIPQTLAWQESSITKDGNLSIKWQHDIPGYENHESIFTSTFLNDSRTTQGRKVASHNVWEHVAWDKGIVDSNITRLTFDHKDYVNDSDAFQRAILNLQKYGLIFIENTPSTEESIVRMANRIGPLKNTFYGMTWDVKSVPSAKNVAYTSSNLDFHMDLLYMADPPGIQLLHVLKQSTAGGESRFSDAVAAFDRLQVEYPELVEPLVTFPITYHYKNDGRWLQQTRFFLEGGESGRGPPKTQSQSSSLKYTYPKDYETINWSPPFQGPVARVDELQDSAFKDYIRAAKKFKDLVSEASAVYETKMGEGICAIFNNRRILHARKPFSSEGGERWLKGCYVDGDYLRDRYRVLEEAKSQV